jgi:hypothetical protein
MRSGTSGDVFLMNTFTDAQFIVSRDVAGPARSTGRRAICLRQEKARGGSPTSTEHGFVVSDQRR